MWVMQPDATLDESPPTSGLKYTVLDTVKNARIIGVSVNVTWTVQPTPLQIHITIDGETTGGGFTDPVSTTFYFGSISPGSANIISVSDVDRTAYRAFLIEGKSIKIEVETTGGTVSNMSARVKYALRR